MKKLVLIMALAGMICFPALAGATLISYTISISSQLTDWDHNLVFPKFNSALGTLTQIELYLDTGSNGTTGLTTSFTVSSLTTTDGHAQTVLQIGVLDPASNLLASMTKTFPGGFPAGYHFHIDGAGGTSSGTYVAGASSDTFYTSAAMLNEFTGSGNINLDALTFTQTTATWNGGTPDVHQTTDAGLTGTVTYTYLPVPAPATMLLLGSGLVGLGLLRRKWSLKK